MRELLAARVTDGRNPIAGATVRFQVLTGGGVLGTKAFLDVTTDVLGIAAELEADMARVIDTYECEWRRAINDPVTLKRFRHFVNSDRADDNIVFTAERGQIRPATREERELRSTEVG